MNKTVIIRLLIIAGLLCAGVYGTFIYRQQEQQPLTLYGNVDIRTVNLSFRVAGRLATLRVDEGDEVQPEMLLGQLDDAPYRHALQQAEANVASASAQLSLLRAGYRAEEIAQVRASVAQQQAAYDYAENYLQRQQGLWNSRSISANDLADARTQRDQAAASLQNAKEKLTQYLNGNRPQEIAEAEANLAQAQAAQALAQLNLQDTRLFSPSGGTVSTRAVEPGTMLNAGATVLTLSLTRPVWIRAYISEPYLMHAQPGSKVEIITDGRPHQPYHGQIGFVSPSAEFTPKSVETTELRTDLVYRLRIIVTDADEGLRQGMPVTVRFAAP